MLSSFFTSRRLYISTSSSSCSKPQQPTIYFSFKLYSIIMLRKFSSFNFQFRWQWLPCLYQHSASSTQPGGCNVGTSTSKTSGHSTIPWVKELNKEWHSFSGFAPQKSHKFFQLLHLLCWPGLSSFLEIWHRKDSQ